MQVIPLIPKPSQTVNVALGGQSCRLNVYQKSTGLFCDVYVNDALIIGGVIAENVNRIVRSLYLGFIGDLVFLDTQGASDPDYTGLGTRFIFLYFSPAEVAAFNADALAVLRASIAAFTPVPQPPVTPTGLLATPGLLQNVITWSTVAGYVYDLYWSLSPSVTIATGTKIAGVTSGYTHTGLTANTRYYYILEATNSTGQSAISAEVNALTLPAQPTGLSAVGGLQEFTATWTMIPGLSYDLYYSTTPGVTPGTGTHVAAVVSPHVQTGLLDTTTYYMIIVASNASGAGPASAESSATTSTPAVAWPGQWWNFNEPAFSPYASDGPMTLSGTNNLTITQTGHVGLLGAFSSHFETAVAQSCSVTIAAVGVSAQVGIANKSAITTHALGTDGTSYAYNSDGTKSFNGVNSAYGAAYTTADVILTNFDPVAQTLSFSKNGVSQGVAFTGIAVGTGWALAVGLDNGTSVTAALSGPYYAAFDEAAHSTMISLGVGDRECNANGNFASYINACGSKFLSSGERYAEFTCLSNSLNATRMGIAQASDGFADGTLPGTNPNSYAYDLVSSPTNGKWHNNVGAAYGTPSGAGITISMLWNANTGELSFWRQGVDMGVAYTGVSGGSWRAIVGGYAQGNGISFIVNFGASPWIYTPPAGYVGWV